MVINDCNDVDTVSIVPTDLDVMLWDGSNSKWIPDSTVNANITANTTNISTNTANIAINTNALTNFVINDCGDVDTVTKTPVVHDVMLWDGGTWVPDASIYNTITSNSTLIQGNTTRLDNFVINNDRC